METFKIWFSIGVEHILALDGLDHILFILSLALANLQKGVKSLAWVTLGFTLGHSITLVLAGLGYFKFNKTVIEVLIPLTIAISAASNIFRSGNFTILWQQLTLATGFGLIHGLGFSGSVASLLGVDSVTIFTILFFNIGIEVGQLVVIFFCVLADVLVVNYLKIEKKKFYSYFSGVILIAAIFMMINRLMVWL